MKLKKIFSFFLNLIVISLIVIILLEILLNFFPVRESSNSLKQTKKRILHFEPNREFLWSNGPFFSIKSIKKSNNYGFLSDYDYIKEKSDILVIGDSFVEAMQVNNEKTFHHLLAKKKSLNIYSLGHSSSQLAQYYKYAEWGVKEFKPRLIIYSIIANDYLDSLVSKNKYIFDLNSENLILNNDLDSKRTNLEKIISGDSNIKKILKKSALVRYLIFNLNLKGRLNWIINKNKNGDNLYIANSPISVSSSEMRKAKKVVDLFIKLNKKFLDQNIKIIFVFDGFRNEIYENVYEKDHVLNSYPYKIRNYFINESLKNQFLVIDLQEYFLKDYLKNQKRFDFIDDFHWNERGHKIVFKAIDEKLTKDLFLFND